MFDQASLQNIRDYLAEASINAPSQCWSHVLLECCEATFNNSDSINMPSGDLEQASTYRFQA
eukprot:3567664-Amphidinium_carterae.1